MENGKLKKKTRKKKLKEKKTYKLNFKNLYNEKKKKR